MGSIDQFINLVGAFKDVATDHMKHTSKHLANDILELDELVSEANLYQALIVKRFDPAITDGQFFTRCIVKKGLIDSYVSTCYKIMRMVEKIKEYDTKIIRKLTMDFEWYYAYLINTRSVARHKIRIAHQTKAAIDNMMASCFPRMDRSLFDVYNYDRFGSSVYLSLLTSEVNLTPEDYQYFVNKFDSMDKEPNPLIVEVLE